MTTLHDVVKEYQDSREKDAREYAERERERKEIEERDTREMFEKIGLYPYRVEGNHAYFIYEDQEIHFLRFYDHYEQVRRFLPNCPACGSTMSTHGYHPTRLNIGMLIANPEPQYHGCYPEDKQDAVAFVKSPREKLLDALCEFIQETTNTNY